MALTNTPVWPQAPKIETAAITTANTATDGSGTITTVATAGENGRRIAGLYAGARATVTATAVRFFISDDSGATWTYLPRLDALIPAHTLANTTANAGRVTVIDPEDQYTFLDLPADAVLGATIAVALAGGVVIVAEGHDF
jgi:hypothetical protein